MVLLFQASHDLFVEIKYKVSFMKTKRFTFIVYKKQNMISVFTLLNIMSST